MQHTEIIPSTSNGRMVRQNVNVVTNSGIYVTGQGDGFLVTAPADTAARVFTIYAGVWNSRLQVNASLRR